MRIVAALVVAALVGCTSEQSVRDEPSSLGYTQEFRHPSDRTVSAVKEAVLKLGMTVSGQDRVGDQVVIIARKPMTWETFGDIVRITVIPDHGASTVRILTKTYSMASPPHDLSGDIFTGIGQQLGDHS